MMFVQSAEVLMGYLFTPMAVTALEEPIQDFVLKHTSVLHVPRKLSVLVNAMRILLPTSA